MLRDLGKLADELSGDYPKFLRGLGEKPLSESFKSKYKEIYNREESGDVVFYDKTAKHLSSKGQFSFTPTQWFYIATYWSGYCAELMKYKEIFEEIFNIHFNKAEYKSICNDLRKGKAINQKLNRSIIAKLGDEDAELFKRFLRDYDWWHGSKTIDRADFLNSPILDLAKLVNVNSAIAADICRFIAENDELADLLRMDDIIESQSGEDLAYNLIIYGAPGTGKSYEIKNRAEAIFENENIFRITFHPEFTYNKFVGSYKPESMYRDGKDEFGYYDSTLKEKEEKYEPLIDYVFEPGVFIETFLKAYNNPSEKVLLVIEEINRANVAEVFGDIFQLLDRHDDGSSVYPVKLQKPAMKYLQKKGYKENSVSLPSNLFIWASMNSADQGVFPLDTAFKRRWLFEFLPLNQNSQHIDGVDINFAGEEIEWNSFREAINSHLVTHGVNEDKLIGPFFLGKKELRDKHAVKNKLLLYLRDDVLRHNPSVLFKHDTMSSIFEEYQAGNIEKLFSDTFLEKQNELFQEDDEATVDVTEEQE